MELAQFIIWLTTGGVVVVFSWIVEQFDWFQDLSSNLKRLVTFGGSALLGLAAVAVQTYVPPEVLAGYEKWFSVLFTVFSMVFLSELAHKVDSDKQ